MHNMFKKFSVYLALGGVILAVLLVQKVRRVEPKPAPLAEPSSAPFKNSIGARGIIESYEENVRIAPAVTGLVTEVKVKVGDRVKVGQALFLQDGRSALAAVKVEEAQIGTLQAQITEAEVTLADKSDSLARMETLSARQVASIDERQRVRFAAQVATTQLATARVKLMAAEVLLARSKVQLGLLTVEAPRAGTVLQVNIRAGETSSVSASEPAILLGQIDDLQIRADIDEDNASKVRPGCRAVAYLKGRREDAMPLSFVRIEPYILPKKSLTGESSERVDTRVLQVIFRFVRTATPVYVGQQVDVFLDAGEPNGVETGTPKSAD